MFAYYYQGRRKKEEGRRKKEEGRRKKEEGRRKKEEGRRKKLPPPTPPKGGNSGRSYPPWGEIQEEVTLLGGKFRKKEGKD
ncbi:MAG: hypothetical protein ACM65M_03330 [Microcoleus sp.]